MRFTPPLRKLTLTSHVVLSVGWLGAVTAFLALAILGLVRDDIQLVNAAYVAMEAVAWYVILPLGAASFLSGLVQSFGSEWGVFRHWWVVAKLLITVASTLLLLLHMGPITHMGEAAVDGVASSPEFQPLRVQLVANAGIALIALAVATGLSVYKPRGMTAYGQRKQRAERKA